MHTIICVIIVYSILLIIDVSDMCLSVGFQPVMFEQPQQKMLLKVLRQYIGRG